MATQNIDLNIISGLKNSMLNGYLASVNNEVQDLKEQSDTKCCMHYLHIVYFPNQIIIATNSMNCVRKIVLQ